MKVDSSSRASSLSLTVQFGSLKNSLAVWDELVSKSNKMSTSISSTIQCVAGFLEALQKVSDVAQQSNSGLRDLGAAMTRFCLRERGVESRLRTFNSHLSDSLAAPLADRLEEWRRSVTVMDRENNKDWRRAKTELQRATVEAEKWKKRLRRKDSYPTMAFSSQTEGFQGTPSSSNVQANFAQHDLQEKQRALADLERTSLRRAVIEERRRFAELITCLKPVLDAQLTLFSDLNLLEDAVAAIYAHSVSLSQLPSEVEKTIESSAWAVDGDPMSNPVPTKGAVPAVGAVPHIPPPLSNGAASADIATGSAALLFAAAHPLPPSNLSSLGCNFRASELSLQSTTSSAVSALGGLGFLNTDTQSLFQVPDCAADDSLVNSSTTLNSISTTAADALSPSAIASTTERQRYMEAAHISPTMSNGIGDAISLFESNNLDLASLTSSTSIGHSESHPESKNGKPMMTNGEVACFPRQYSCAGTAGRTFAGDEEEGTATESTDGGTEDDDDYDEEDGDGAAVPPNDGRHLVRRHTLGPSDMPNRSSLFPNQILPPPVYTNLSQLQKAAAQRYRLEGGVTPGTPDAGEPQPSKPVEARESPGMALLRTLAASGGDLPPEEALISGDVDRLRISTAREGPSSPPGGPGHSNSSASSLEPSSSSVAQVRGQTEVIYASSSASVRGIKSAASRDQQRMAQMLDQSGGGEAALSCLPGSELLPQAIATAVTSGTSTFRRRQSECVRPSRLLTGEDSAPYHTGSPTFEPGHGCRFFPQQNNHQQSGFSHAHSRGLFTPMTPGTPRRSNATGGDYSERSIRPPRRSSSVSRELTNGLTGSCGHDEARQREMTGSGTLQRMGGSIAAFGRQSRADGSRASPTMRSGRQPAGLTQPSPFTASALAAEAVRQRLHASGACSSRLPQRAPGPATPQRSAFGFQQPTQLPHAGLPFFSPGPQFRQQGFFQQPRMPTTQNLHEVEGSGNYYEG